MHSFRIEKYHFRRKTRIEMLLNINLVSLNLVVFNF